MEGSAGVLMSVAGPSDLTLLEVNQAAGAVSQHCDSEANVIFGAVIDDSFGEEVRVTVIAAGFEGYSGGFGWTPTPGDVETTPLPPADFGGDPSLDIPDFVEG